MNKPTPPESLEKANKLIIRSEVLAVVRQLVSMVDPPKQERLKLIKRLQDLGHREHVQDILVKELQRAGSSEALHVVTEFLMELGDIDYLQDRLWGVIRDPKARDEIKDAANLVLRHLGDASDPDLYLEYLEDPQGLIGRETIRMLEVSSENPEALIDFIDFILSLNAEDQVRLLTSLQRDYPSEYLVNLYVPLLESDPSPELWEQLVVHLGETKSPYAAELLSRLVEWPEDRLPIPKRLVEKSLKTLQIAGAFHPEKSWAEVLQRETVHPLARDTVPYQCFITLSDGIGNQGMIVSRQRANGDITMLSVALNDVHGIIDCFGFYQLSLGDFHKIIDKFHEGATKIKVSPEYCAWKLSEAEARNQKNAFRLPYEYRCWRPLVEGTDNTRPEDYDQVETWMRREWVGETDNLYQHPDFNSWFLEQGDEASVNRWLQQVVLLTDELLTDGDMDDLTPYIEQLERVADNLVQDLLATEWRQLMAERLREAAYLLHCQNTHTFRNLAATEVYKLSHMTNPDDLLTGFMRAYGRRCVSEELLRLRTGSSDYDRYTPVIDAVFACWEA